MGTGAQLAMLPWFVRDYIAATRHFSLAERGAYTDLLFFQWENGRLPIEPERLARLVGCSIEQFSEVWGAIQSKFAEAPDGSLLNQRLEEHRAKAIELSLKRSTAGKAGGKQSAKHRASNTQSSEPDLLTGLVPANDNPPSPSPSPSPKPSQEDTDTSQSRSRTAYRSTRARTPYDSAEFRQKLGGIFRETCPLIPKIREWTPTRVNHLNARIRESLALGKPADALPYWQGIADKVEASSFLSRRAPGNRSWRFSIPWLVQSTDNFNKVLEGVYDDQGRGTGARNGR